jgi:hypothetical protein
MIVYDLACTLGHRFEGWFASADDFGGQSRAGLVRCPVCDDAGVSILPGSKVHVSRAVAADAPASAPETQPATAEVAAGIPPELVRKLREIVRNTENVGRRFPEEARRIHYEESPARPIRGQASPEEAKSLREEGIEFASLPPFLTQDTH